MRRRWTGWMLLACGILLLAFGSTPARAAWPGVEYAEVRAFAWPATAQLHEVVSERFEIAPGAVEPEGRKLDESQIARVLLSANRLENRAKRDIVSGCYWPRNAFVFYDAKGTLVAFFELCFDCHGNHLQPERKSRRVLMPDYADLLRLFHELGLPFGSDPLAKAVAAARELDRKYYRGPRRKSARP